MTRLPRRTDTVAALDAVTVAGGTVTIESSVIAGSGVQNGPEPEQLFQVAEAEAEFYLDAPLPERYVRWLGDFVTGDMGPQFSKTGEPPVTDLIKERLPRTAMLLILAQFMAVVISIPWALWSAAKSDTAVDKFSTVTTFLIIALPNFALGVILKYLLAIQTRMVSADLRGERSVAGPSVAADAAGVHDRAAGGGGLSTSVAHRSDHHAAGGLHPHGAQQRGDPKRGAVQARAPTVVVLVPDRVRHHHGCADRRFTDRRDDLPGSRARFGDRRSGRGRRLPDRCSRS